MNYPGCDCPDDWEIFGQSKLKHAELCPLTLHLSSLARSWCSKTVSDLCATNSDDNCISSRGDPQKKRPLPSFPNLCDPASRTHTRQKSSSRPHATNLNTRPLPATFTPPSRMLWRCSIPCPPSLYLTRIYRLGLFLQHVPELLPVRPRTVWHPLREPRCRIYLRSHHAPNIASDVVRPPRLPTPTPFP